MNTKEGSVVISIVLGFGLATMFRLTCKNGKNCIVVKGPKMADINNKHYKIESDCYKYSPYVVECGDDAETSPLKSSKTG